MTIILLTDLLDEGDVPATDLFDLYLARWSIELSRQAAAGNERAHRTFALTYHLLIRPIALFHPALFLSAVRAAVLGRGAPVPRPEVLETLRHAQPHDSTGMTRPAQEG